MKLATAFVLASLTLAALAWLLSRGGAGSVHVDRSSVALRISHEARHHATALDGEPGNLSVSPTAKGLPATTRAAADQSGTASLEEESPLSGNNLSRIGRSDTAADRDTEWPSQDVGTAATALLNDSLSQSLLPVTSAETLSASPPLAVPAGARLPALFLDERPLPPPQRRILDRVANEFIDAVAGDPAGQNRVLWETAREAADQQYIKLYGHAAYNALHLRAAREAVREQRATATPTAR
jgi:hypothetical protein